MWNIAKSYLKSYFQNWITAFTVIFCILIVFVVFIGGISSPFQFKIYYDHVKQNSNLWNYNLYDNDSSLKDDFLYKYFEFDPNGDTFLNTKDDKNKKLISGTTIIGKDKSTYVTWTGYLGNFKDAKDKEEAIVYMIKHNLGLHNGGKYDIKLKDASKYNIDTKGYSILEKFNKYWLNKLGFIDENNNLIYKNNSLIKFLLNEIFSKKKINYNYSVNYSIYHNDIKNNNYFLLNPSNYKNINNVVSNYKKELSMNSIIISSRYAKYRNLKIGDSINILNFINNKSLYNKFKVFDNYKIVGFGNSISNLEPIDSFSGLTNSLNNYANIYFNDNEFNNIISLLESEDIKDVYNTNNFVYYISNNFKINYSNFELLNNNWINKIIDNPTWYDFDSLNFNVDFKQTNIEVIIFIIVALITLFISFLFFSFIINRDIKSTINQIGIFKSFGYNDISLSWILSFKVFITMFISAFLGFFISIPIQIFMKNTFSQNITFYIKNIWFNPYFITILWILIPIIFTIFATILIFKIINKKPNILLNTDSIQRNSKFNMFISKWFSKTKFIFKLNIVYAVRNKFKLITIFIVFAFCIFLSILQLNSLSLFKSISYPFNGVYNKNVDHLNYFKTENNNIDYNHKQQKFEEKHKSLNFVDMKNSSNKIVKMADQNRIIINKSPFNIADLLKEKINGFSIYFNDLKKVLNMSEDKSIKKYKDEINILYNKLSNPNQTIFTINDYAYNSSFTNLNGLLKMKYYTNIKNKSPIQKRANVYLINNETLNYLNFNSATVEGNYKSLFYQNNSDSLNVVISTSLADRTNLSINNNFNAFITTNNTKRIFKMHVIGIYKTDKFHDNVYINSKQFKQNYFKDPNKHFYNYAISKNKEILNIDKYNINNMNNNIKFNQPYLNYYLDYENISNDETLFNLENKVNINEQGFLNANTLLSSFNLDTVNNINIPLMNKIISHYLNSILTIFTLLEIIIFIVLTMIMVILVNVTIDETKKFIMILKATGYKKREINFVIMNSFIFISTLALITAFIGIYLFWKFIKAFLFNNYLFTISIPGSILTNIMIIGIFILIILVSWLSGYYLINKKNINKLNE